MTWVNKRVKTFDLAKLKTGEQKVYGLELTADAPAKINLAQDLRFS